jgi:hypothetical protein
MRTTRRSEGGRLGRPLPGAPYRPKAAADGLTAPKRLSTPWVLARGRSNALAHHKCARSNGRDLQSHHATAARQQTTHRQTGRRRRACGARLPGPRRRTARQGQAEGTGPIASRSHVRTVWSYVSQARMECGILDMDQNDSSRRNWGCMSCFAQIGRSLCCRFWSSTLPLRSMMPPCHATSSSALIEAEGLRLAGLLPSD